jgi:molybdopterin-guanine dinucleotide biosynthesis protein A
VGLIVVAGGRSRRWGGVDKTAQLLAERPVLVHTLSGAIDGLIDGDAAADGMSVPVVVVAPAGHPARSAAHALRPDLGWTFEHPSGGGPAAGLAAGLRLLRRPDDDAPGLVVVLAGDMPFAGTAIPRLLAALADGGGGGGADAAVGTDPDGVRQPLLALYRTAPLAAALAALPATDASMRAVLAHLRVIEVAITAREAFDLDTPEHLRLAAATISRRDSTEQPEG